MRYIALYACSVINFVHGCFEWGINCISKLSMLIFIIVFVVVVVARSNASQFEYCKIDDFVVVLFYSTESFINISHTFSASNEKKTKTEQSDGWLWEFSIYWIIRQYMRGEKCAAKAYFSFNSSAVILWINISECVVSSDWNYLLFPSITWNSNNCWK